MDSEEEDAHSGGQNTEDHLETSDKRTRSETSTKRKSPTPATDTKSPKAAKRSHHKKQSCQVLGCNFEGYDLKRHMQLHVRKGEISEQNVSRLSSIMSRGQNQRGKSRQTNASGKSKKGRFKKWCPVPGCDSIVVNIGRHLSARKGHNIKRNSAHYIRLLKTAQRYTGTAEVQTYLARPNESKEEDQEEEGQEEFQMEQGSQSADGMEENGEDSKEADSDQASQEDSEED